MRTIIVKALRPSEDKYNSHRLLFGTPVSFGMVPNISPYLDFSIDIDVHFVPIDEKTEIQYNVLLSKYNLHSFENIEGFHFYIEQDKDYLMFFQREGRDEIIDNYFKEDTTFFARGTEQLMLVGKILQVLPYKI